MITEPAQDTLQDVQVRTHLTCVVCEPADGRGLRRDLPLDTARGFRGSRVRVCGTFDGPCTKSVFADIPSSNERVTDIVSASVSEFQDQSLLVRLQ